MAERKEVEEDGVFLFSFRKSFPVSCGKWSVTGNYRKDANAKAWVITSVCSWNFGLVSPLGKQKRGTDKHKYT